MNSYTIATGMPALKIPREVAALMAALQLRESDNSLLEKLDDHEWNSLLTFCDLSHLTLLLAQLPAARFPSWVVERLKTNTTDNAQRFERVKATYKETAEVLNRAGVDHIVIKGFTQAPDYVHDPCLRAQSDIDLYCPADKIEAARIALQSIGYKPSEGIDYSRADHTPTMVRRRDWKWEGNHFDPEMPLSIELHFCLWNEAIFLFPIPEVDRFWERRTTRVVDSLSFPSLSPVDHLGYLTLHILRNILPGDWVVHHVRELAVFLHSHANDDTFWKTWRETHDPSLRSFEAIAFYYARAWFGCDLHRQAEDEITRLSPLQQRWLHYFAGSAFEAMFHRNKDWVWLHLSFLKTFRAKLTLLRQVFIPRQVPQINAPAIRIKNRQPKSSSEAHPYRQYVAYIAFRCISYSYLNLTTILRGLRWRFS